MDKIHYTETISGGVSSVMYNSSDANKKNRGLMEQADSGINK